MNSAPSLLLAMGDPVLRRSVAAHLRGSAGLAVTEAGSWEEALAQAAGHALMVVDDGLDAGALCLALGEAGLSLPLVLLGSLPASSCRTVEAVVAKPLRLPLLAARIREVLDRARLGIRIGPWHFDQERSVLLGEGGALLRLTAKETAILRRLLAEGEASVPRQTLLDDIWGYGEGIDTHTLETHIYRLRRKLGAGVLVSGEGGYRLLS